MRLFASRRNATRQNRLAVFSSNNMAKYEANVGIFCVFHCIFSPYCFGQIQSAHATHTRRAFTSTEYTQSNWIHTLALGGFDIQMIEMDEHWVFSFLPRISLIRLWIAIRGLQVQCGGELRCVA